MAKLKYGKMLHRVHAVVNIPYQFPEKGCEFLI